MSVLEFYNRLARRFHVHRPLLWLISGFTAAVAAGTLFLSGGSTDEAYTLASITVLMWSLCLIMVTYGFSAPLPCIDSNAGLLARLKLRAKLGFLWLMAIVTTALSLLVAFVSLRALGIVIRSM